MLPPTSHRNLALHATAADILTRTHASGGATFELEPDGHYRELHPETGYAVGLSGGWVGAPTYEALLGALYDLERGGRLPGTFGTWLSEGRLYLEPVSIVGDRDAAIALGMAHNERAIYSFARGRDIRLRCAYDGCDAPMFITITAHAHTENGKDVTGR